MGDTLFVPSVVSQLPYNPLCLVRYVESVLPPDEWENVRFHSQSLCFAFRLFYVFIFPPQGICELRR